MALNISAMGVNYPIETPRNCKNTISPNDTRDLDQLLDIVVALEERIAAGQYRQQNHTAAPHVNRSRLVFVPKQDLWRTKPLGSKSVRFPGLAETAALRNVVFRAPEINDFTLPSVHIEQEVRRLNVPVQDFLRVYVPQRFEERTKVLLRELAVEHFHDHAEGLELQVLEHHHGLIVFAIGAQESDNSRVMKTEDALCLLEDKGRLVRPKDFLQCNVAPGLDVDGVKHVAARASVDQLSPLKFVIPHSGRGHTPQN